MYEQLSFQIKGLRRLTASQRQRLKEAGRARFAQMSISQRQELGRKGYQRAIERNPDFHKQGAAVTTSLYFYTSPDSGAVGYEAAVADGAWQPKGKRHRYYGACKCHNSSKKEA